MRDPHIFQISQGRAKPDGETGGREYVSRIIQYQGKRSNIRLEAAFWDILEEMARAKRCKLNVLVNEIISHEQAGNNNTAYLRYRAVSWLNRRLETANEQLFLKNTEVRAILDATRLPAFIFSSRNMLSRYNFTFQDWLKANIAEDFEDFDVSAIRISFRRSFGAIKSDLKINNGLLDKEPGAILLPGYVFPVSINLVALNNYSDKGKVYMGLFNLGKDRAKLKSK